MILYTDKLNQIVDFLQENKIDISEPGFFDDPNFLAFEKEDPRFLICYAKYVYGKKYNSEYLKNAEQKIIKVCEIMYSELVKDGRKGACIDLSVVLARILDKLGVWNFVVKGAVAIEFPENSQLEAAYYWPLDTNDAKAGHVWIYAPPFKVIDLTLHEQPYPNSEQNYLPDKTLLKKHIPVNFSIKDLCSPEFRTLMAMEGFPLSLQGVYRINPEIKRFVSTFKISSVLEHKGTKVNYIPCAVGGSDRPLEEIESLNLSGKTGYEVYKESIEPLFK